MPLNKLILISQSPEWFNPLQHSMFNLWTPFRYPYISPRGPYKCSLNFSLTDYTADTTYTCSCPLCSSSFLTPVPFATFFCPEPSSPSNVVGFTVWIQSQQWQGDCLLMFALIKKEALICPWLYEAGLVGEPSCMRVGRTVRLSFQKSYKQSLSLSLSVLVTLMLLWWLYYSNYIDEPAWKHIQME